MSLSLALIVATPVFSKYLQVDKYVEVENIECASNKDSKILIDSPIKQFVNLNKVGKYLDFDFKVPEYFGNDFFVSDILVTKSNIGTNYLTIYFTKTYKDNDDITLNDIWALYEFTGDISENIKSIQYENNKDYSNMQVSTEEKILGSVEGMYVTLSAESNVDNNVKETSEFFLFNKDGVNYVVRPEQFNDEENLNTEINKIATSLKSPYDIESEMYKIHTNNYVPVFDEDDLNEAAKYIGFTPKFVSKINDDVKIEACNTFYGNPDKSANTSMFNCYYSFKDKENIIFIQDKGVDLYEYEYIATNGYATLEDLENNETKDIPVEKLTWNNIDVYKYFDESINLCRYQWKVDDIYYSLTSSDGSIDDIAKVFVEA